MKLSPVRKNLFTAEKPYEIKNGELWMLPLDKNANGVKQGDVLAELDNGFLYVWDKNMAWNSVSYVPKSRVINTNKDGAE